MATDRSKSLSRVHTDLHKRILCGLETLHLVLKNIHEHGGDVIRLHVGESSPKFQKIISEWETCIMQFVDDLCRILLLLKLYQISPLPVSLSLVFFSSWKNWQCFSNDNN